MDRQQMRSQIDEIDQELMELFNRRMEISRKMAIYKMENDLPVLDETRERIVIETAKRRTRDEWAAYAANWFKALMQGSRAAQEQLMREGNTHDG